MTYLVVWTKNDELGDRLPKTDYWEAFIDDNAEEQANERYNQLIEQEDTYIANIAKITKSTDYEI